ncbi:MAG: aspartate kinase [Clostridia bacterium]|nr:aspartate kinase [Clostridia bacterium]
MKTTVVKFGGTSLATAAQIRKAAAIIKADPARRFVVASAPGKRDSADTKVTDLLYRCYDLASGGKDFTPALDEIRARFAEIIADLGVEFDLGKELQIIRSHLENDPQRDYMASRGEYLNSRILAKFLGFTFLDAAAMVCFFPNGRFDANRTDALLRTELAKTESAVIPGFYGASDDGRIHTFSRGGSDVTGSLVACAADASLYENWTDVSGMLFTDPRIVKDPHTISVITYRELRELSYMGATVLHEDAVFPVRKAGIPINIRNTNRPDDDGTMIVPDLPADMQKRIVTGIAGRKGFTSVLVEKSMMSTEVGFGAKIMGIFAANNTPFEHCPTGIDTISVIVNSAQFREKKEAILQQIRHELQPEYICVEGGLAMIAIVGHGLVYAKGSAARVFGTLAKAGINVRMIDQGSSEMNIIVGVAEEDYEAAIQSLYEEFC